MSNALAIEFLETITSRLKGSSLTSCSRWTANKRIIPDIVTEELGPFSWRLTPWVKDMMDSQASYNYAMKGAQLGVTEVGINVTFFTMDVKGRHVLYVLPTQHIASQFSKARFTPALAVSPEIKKMFTDTNTVHLKVAGRANLYITGSRGEGNLREKPANVLILDEVDVMDQRAIGQALKRLAGKMKDQRLVWAISTPTIPDYGIHEMYLTGTQEHFVFQCPHCSRHIDLQRENLVICGDGVTDPDIYKSHLKCIRCDTKIHHDQKPEFLSTGFWKSTAPNHDPDRRSFSISELYSFTIEPHEIAAGYFAGLTSEKKAQEHWNQELGLPRIGDGAQISNTQINACMGTHSREHGKRPKQIGEMFTTLGVDKGKVCHYVVMEWMKLSNIKKDLATNTVGKVVDFGSFSEDHYDQRIKQLMQEWIILATVLDPDPGRADARRVARTFPSYVWLCQYRQGVTGNEMGIGDKESGAPVVTVDKTGYVSIALGRFKTNKIILPIDLTDEFRTHVKNPVRCYVRKDRKTEGGLILPGPMVLEYLTNGPDHYAMALTYCEVGLPLAAMRSQNAQNISEYL